MFNRKSNQPMPAPAGAGPAISLDKVPSGLVSLTKAAAVSLEKSGLSGHRAAVYLVLDHSGSMTPYYSSGAVQHLAEQALGLSANLDDDGSVPMVYFHTTAESPVTVDLSGYAGVVGRTQSKVRWGYTNYAAAMYAVAHHYRESGATDPALVIFQTDGEPFTDRGDARAEAERALKDLSAAPIFWAFVGFGPEQNMRFLQKLDGLRGRAVDNASFFHAENPLAISDADLYDGLTGEFAGWLGAAHAKGII